MSEYTPIPDGYKRCSKCGEIKSRAEFSRHAGKRDGVETTCKACRAEYSRRYRADHPEEVQEYNRQYQADHVEKLREYNRRYKAEHLEEDRERKRRYRAEKPEEERRYRAAHAEELRERSRRYRADHPEERRRYRVEHADERREYRHARRAREQSAPGHHTAADIRLQVRAQTDKRGRLICWWCGKPIEGIYHEDHRIPLTRGGTNWPENIVITHEYCNLSKGTKLPWEFDGRLL